LIISNRARFIKDIIEGKLKVNNVPRETIINYLKKNKYDQVDGSYGYLLGMAIYTLTKEKFEELLKQRGDKEAEIEITKKTNPKDMYIKDLEKLKKSIA
jgi:hypothetical protein